MNNKRTTWQYIKDNKFNSLIIKYFAIIICIIIVPFSIISYFNTNNMKQIITNEINTSSLTTLSGSGNIIDNCIRQADVLATNISLQKNVNLFMYSSNTSEIIDYNYDRIKDYIALNGIIFSYIDSIYVYSEKNNTVVTKNDITMLENFGDTTWLSSLQKTNGNKIDTEKQARLWQELYYFN